MTYNEALRIQRAQLYFYRKHIGRWGIRVIRHNTSPCPKGIHPEEPISVIDINELVPRGGAFEKLINYLGPRMRLRQAKNNRVRIASVIAEARKEEEEEAWWTTNLESATHSAILRGLA